MVSGLCEYDLPQTTLLNHQLVLTHNVPTLALSIFTTPVCPVNFITNKWCCDGVSYLSSQHGIAGENIVKLNDVVEVDEEVGEPHRGTEVIEDMSDAVGEPLYMTQLMMDVAAWW